MKKWIINYHLPEDVQPGGAKPSRSFECQSGDENDFGKVEARFLKKHPTAVIQAMRCLGAVEEL